MNTEMKYDNNNNIICVAQRDIYIVVFGGDEAKLCAVNAQQLSELNARERDEILVCTICIYGY